MWPAEIEDLIKSFLVTKVSSETSNMAFSVSMTQEKCLLCL